MNLYNVKNENDFLVIHYHQFVGYNSIHRIFRYSFQVEQIVFEFAVHHCHCFIINMAQVLSPNGFFLRCRVMCNLFVKPFNLVTFSGSIH